MLKGDISNEVTPQWLFVWEDQIATLPKERIGRYKRAMRMHRYTTACSQWRADVFSQRWLADFAWRLGEKFSVVTFMHGQHWAAAVEEWCEIQEIQSSRCYYFPDRLTLARALSTWPSVRGVVDPSAPGAYGAQGYGGLTSVGR